jgi:hypothetical protein
MIDPVLTQKVSHWITPFSPPSGPLMSFLKGHHPKSNSLATDPFRE